MENNDIYVHQQDGYSLCSRPKLMYIVNMKKKKYPLRLSGFF